MKVKTFQLKEGCILSSDVKSLTKSPIVPKKTVLNQEHINYLHAFLIMEVEIEDKLANGEFFMPNDQPNLQQEEAAVKTSFVDQYLNSVEEYKKLFRSWQSNAPIDMPLLRKAIVPLLESAVESPGEIFYLHHYSSKEDYVYHHSVAVAILCAILAKRLQFQKGDWIQIGLAGALSDSGMAKINPKIIEKKGQLTHSEFLEVKQHPILGFEMLQQVKVIKDDVRKAVLQHHERIDGSGYPKGDKANLHPYGRIIAVADTFHAMTSERHYKDKQSPFKVLETILEDSFGKFDIKVVQALTKALTSFSTGTKIRLSNNQIGEIVFIEQKSPTRPMIRLYSGEIIQLINHRELFIEEIL